MPNSRRATSSRARSSSSSSAAAPSVSTRAPRSAARFPQAFPTVFRFCSEAGIDPRVQNIPVAPAAHYHMGGIAVDEWGRTSLAGCGPAARPARPACTARIVSRATRCSKRWSTARALPPTSPNSALEAAQAYAAGSQRVRSRSRASGAAQAQAINDLRNVMYANVGLVRNDAGLREALARIAELEAVRRDEAVAQSARRRTADRRGRARAPREPRQPLSKRLPANR